MDNFYNILNIPEDSGNQDIKDAFRKLAKQYHPDMARGDSEKFRQISHAYKVLSDSESRNDYDKTLSNFQRKTSAFGDYTKSTYTVQGKHLKALVKEVISQGDATGLTIRYKGKELFSLSFPTAAVVILIGLLKAPIAFLLFQAGLVAFFEIEVTNQVISLFNEAVECHNTGRITEAERLYKNILRKSEYFMPARVSLGLLYRQRGENRKAVQCFRQVLETAPFGEIGEIARRNLSELRGF